MQDQYASAFGGFNSITFSKDGVIVKPLPVGETHLHGLEENLLLVFTGFTRFSDAISAENKNNISRNIKTLDLMKQMVSEGERLLAGGNLDDFGRLLGESWKMKRTLARGISNPFINEIYAKALKNGALGGKILGSGGGGFMLLYAPKNTHIAICNALSVCQFIPFHFESRGAEIIYGD